MMASSSSSRPLCSRCHSCPSTFKIRNVNFCNDCLCNIVESRPKGAFELARGAATGYWAQLMADGQSEDSILPTITIAFSGGMASRIMLRLAIRHFCYGIQQTNNDSQQPSNQQEEAEEEQLVDGEVESKKKTKKKRSQRENGSKRPKEPRIGKIVIACIDESSVIPEATSSLSTLHSALLSELYDPSNVYATIESHLRPIVQFVPLKLQDSFLKDQDLNRQMNGWKVGMDDDEDVHEWDQIEKEMLHLRESTEAEFVECGAEHSAPRNISNNLSRSTSSLSSLLSFFHRISGSSTATPTQPPTSPSPSALTRLSTLLPLLTSHLLQSISHHHSSTCLLLGSSSTRSAIEFFSRVSSGGGGQWSVVGRKEGWRNGLLVLYPFRDSIDKELSYYAALKRLEGCLKNDLSSTYSILDEKAKGRDEKRSIQRLTEAFILSLEAGVPSTVSTISRTGSKLVAGQTWSDSTQSSPTSSSKPISKSTLQHLLTVGNRLRQIVQTAYALPVWDGDHSCPLCHSPAEKGAHGWKERRSILTRSDLEKIPDSAVEEEKKASTTVQTNGDHQDQINLSELLCYSCILVLDVPEPTSTTASEEKGGPKMPLPPYVLESAKRRLREESQQSNKVDSLSNDVESVDLSESTIQSTMDLNADQEENEETPDSISKPRATGREKRSAPRKVEQSEMKNQLGDYLLEEDNEGQDDEKELNGVEKKIRDQMKGNKPMGFRKKVEGEESKDNKPRGTDRLADW